MRLEFTYADESLVAHVAWVRSFARVDTFVHGQRTVSIELFSAFPTGERSFAAVEAQVRCQDGVTLELRRTLWASVWSLIAVRTLVRFETARSGELFVAFSTRVGFLSRVAPSMSD